MKINQKHTIQEVEDTLMPYEAHTEELIDAELYFSNIESQHIRYLKNFHLQKAWWAILAQFIRVIRTFTGSLFVRGRMYNQPWRFLLDYLYKEKLIIEAFLNHESVYTDEPKFFYLSLSSATPTHLTDGRMMPYFGYARGTSPDFSEAFAKTIGELLERHSLTLYRERDLVKGSIRTLRARGYVLFDFQMLASFSEAQRKKDVRFMWDEESEFFWVRGKVLSKGDREVLIPAQLIFLNFRKPEREPVVQYRGSHGAAGMFSREEALLAGIYESVQRDSFLIYWLNHISPPRIDQKTIQHKELQKLLSYIGQYSLEVFFLNVTTDIHIPAYVAVVRDTSGKGPYFSVGGGCERDPYIALRRSLVEAMTTYHWVRGVVERDGYYELPHEYQPFTLSLDDRDRLTLWANPAMAPHFDFLLNGPEQSLQATLPELAKKKFSSPHEELDFVLELLRQFGKGYEVYYYKSSAPFLRQMNYHAVKVIIPALIPLFLKEMYAPLGAFRLRDVPARLGYTALDVYNPYPHPFP